MEDSATSSVAVIGDASDVSGHASRACEEPAAQDGVPSPVPDIRESISAAAAALDAFRTDRQPTSSSPVCDNEPAEAASASTMTPRAYQLEMLQQSLKQNAIVVVSTPVYTQHDQLTNTFADGHRKWKDTSVSTCYLTTFLKRITANSASAILRIKAELERSGANQVSLT